MINKFALFWKNNAEKILNGKKSNFKFQSWGYCDQKSFSDFSENLVIIKLNQKKISYSRKSTKNFFYLKKIQLQLSKPEVFCEKKYPQMC